MGAITDTRFVERDLRAQQQRFERARQEMGTDSALLGIAAMHAIEDAQRAGIKKRIYCVSEIVDSTLMWSHYADSHRGICVVLEAEQVGEVGEAWWVDFAGRSISLSGMVSFTPTSDGSIGTVDRKPEPLSPEQVVRMAVQQVLYEDNPPGLLTFDPDDPRRAVSFELVKHTAWPYERERRVLALESILA